MLLSQGAPYNVLAQSPFELNPVDHAEEILKSLSSEQRKALEQLDTNSNFTISPELVKVIVEFEQAPAQLRTERKNARFSGNSGSRHFSRASDVSIRFLHSMEALPLKGLKICSS